MSDPVFPTRSLDEFFFARVFFIIFLPLTMDVKPQSFFGHSYLIREGSKYSFNQHERMVAAGLCWWLYKLKVRIVIFLHFQAHNMRPKDKSVQYAAKIYRNIGGLRCPLAESAPSPRQLK